MLSQSICLRTKKPKRTNSSVFNDIPSTIFVFPVLKSVHLHFMARIKFHWSNERSLHWRDELKTLCRASEPLKLDNTRYRLVRRQKSHLATFRPRALDDKLRISKRNSWVTQDEKNFWSSAHYDINIVSLIPGSAFSRRSCLTFLYDLYLHDSLEWLNFCFFFVQPKTNVREWIDTIEEDHVLLISC